MSAHSDSRRRNHAHRPGTNWFRAFSYLVLAIGLTAFWYLALVVFIVLFG